MRAVVKDATIRVQEAESQGRGKPGPKVGGFNPGAFKTGPDPRRHLNGPFDGARQKSIEALASQYAQEVVDVLRSLYLDETAPPAVRLAAGKEMLDRGHGKPVDRVAIAQINDQAGGGKVLTRDELMLRLSQKFAGEVSEPVTEIIEHRADTDLTPHTMCETVELGDVEGQDTPHPFSETNDENVD